MIRYCWISQTFLIPSAFNKKVGLEVPHPGVDNSRNNLSDRKYYAYYQWVCFVLFIQGVLFYVPYYLWKVWEGGLMKSITMGMQIAIVADEERGYKKKLLIEYLYRHLKLHHYYAFKYFFCEVLCLINVIGQMYLTDKFFDGEFMSYGLNVIKYTHKEFKYRNDPLVYIFPRMTKCTFHFYGSSGDVQKKDALCLLPLNVVNEKIYIFLWFWFVILSILTCLVIISRLFIFFAISIRSRILKTRCRFSNSKYLDIICKHGNIGDFFVLYLLAKNIDPMIMQDIIAEIGKRIERQEIVSHMAMNGDVGERINML